MCIYTTGIYTDYELPLLVTNRVIRSAIIISEEFVLKNLKTLNYAVVEIIVKDFIMDFKSTTSSRSGH
jgi:hypothetical protein